jgi:hypothetical protein
VYLIQNQYVVVGNMDKDKVEDKVEDRVEDKVEL